jgi:diguanylate cyclase (GGDEF)-like protein
MKNFSKKTPHAATLSSIQTILNSLDAAVYVADLKTHEMIFMNNFAIKNWGEPQGAPCYAIMQKGQSEPCSFCTNHLLVDENDQPTGVHVWQFQNTINDHWYECRDQAIEWIDGRLVRMEIAIDITQRKEIEEELHVAKKNAERRALTDDLTQIKNRRAVLEESQAVFDHVVGTISLVIIDVDYFKRINDKYGHAVGDVVLQELSTLIDKNIRKDDIFGRVGGEEFALILPDTDLQTAQMISEKLRQKINALQINTHEHCLSLTCSFGVSTCSKSSFEELYSNADKALYQAKNDGRDRVVTYIDA